MPLLTGLPAYLVAVLATLLAAAVRLAFDAPLGTAVPLLTFEVGVVLATVAGGRGPGLLATVLGAFLGGLLFLPPRGEFRLVGADAWATMGLFALTSVATIGILEAVRLRLARRGSAELRRRLLGEMAPQISWESTADGSLRRVNDWWTRLTGLTFQQSLGEGWLEAVAPDARERVRVAYREALELGREYHLELPIRRASDGTYRSHVARGAPLHDPAGRLTGWVGVAVDVEDQRQAERRAGDHGALLSALTSNASMGLFILDGEQHCVFMNPAAEALTGFTAGEARGRRIHDLVHHTRRDGGCYSADDCPLVLAARSGERRQGEEVFVHREGYFYDIAYTASPLSEHGRVSGTVFEIRNVSAEKAVRAALEASEERFRLLADAMPQLVWTAGPDGTVDYYNRRAEQYPGLRPLQDGSWQWQPALHPEDEAPTVEAWQRSMTTHQPYLAEHRVRMADGSYHWHLSRAEPVFDADGALVKWYGAATDIDVQKRALEERETLLESERAARAEAQRASQSKDEFVAILSHELRSPLNAILGWTQVLRNLGIEHPTVRHGLEVIERNTRVQAQLIADLLDVHRIVSGKLHLQIDRVNLELVVRAALETVQHAASQKRLVIHESLGPVIGTVLGDAARLQQVVWNLLSNAAKFTPPGGRVDVVVREREHTAEIIVADTGEGIDPELLPTLFDRYRQGDSRAARQQGGLGLGLAIVKQLVDLHGGDVTAESAGRGHGATFRVTLPLSATRIPEARQGDAPAAESGIDGIRVLVVDDEADAREIVTRVLEDRGASVATAASADEALDALRTSVPDVLLSDIGMPRRDGYDLIRLVRALPPSEGGSVPAVALTAFARPEDRARALQSGYQHHLSKPVEASELVAVVASLRRLRPSGTPA